MDLLADLNEPQRQAVLHVDGPLLVLAGAGSGKTRVITRRVAHLIDQGVAPWNILAITFTNKAAEEMRQRVEQLHSPPGTTLCTFHALCARLLREFATEAGLERNYTIYDRDDQLRLAKEAIERAPGGSEGTVPARMLGHISRAKNDLQRPEEYAGAGDDSAFTRRVAAVYRIYEKLLADNNALDFDDLLLRVAYLLRDRPEIRQHLGQRYRYVLIDEYQDTNRAQYLIAHGIAREHDNLCVTGDPDQSIYAWRGANISNILDFESDHPSTTVIRLEENYRSTTPILTVASELISHNVRRKHKQLWTHRQGGADVSVVYCDDQHAEADQIAQRVLAYRDRGGEFGNVAVFYRVNWLSRVLEQTLLRCGVPYRIARGVEFYNRKEIRDVLAYLKLLSNPRDDIACRRVINTPARGIGQSTVKKLRVLAETLGLNLLEACGRGAEAGLSAAPRRKVAAFADLIGSLSRDLDRPVRAIVEDVVLRSGLEDALAGDDPKQQSARGNVAELITAATQFDRLTEGGRLGEYLQQVSLVSDTDHFEGSGGAVTLMTLHAAKGLEFPAVFIVGCEDGLLPMRRGDDRATSAAEAEEERRLAFVGMTRTKDELTLTSARRRMIRGKTQPQVASPFLTEIGDAFVTIEDVTTPSRSRPFARSTGGFYDDVDTRSAVEAIDIDDAVPPEYEYLRPGCRVEHPKFGIGKLIKLRKPWPQTTAEILFEDWGPKKIVLVHARLEVLGEAY